MDLSQTALDLLRQAARHPMGVARIGRRTGSARALEKRGLVSYVGRNVVQVTNAGAREAERLEKGA